jgi:hypothetical protein
MSNRPFNAKKVKVPLALVEDLCQFVFGNPAASALHDELMEIIFKAKEPKRERQPDPCSVCGGLCIAGLPRCFNHMYSLPRNRRGSFQ